MYKQILLFCFLLTCFWRANGQNNELPSISSLQKTLTQKVGDSARANLLLQLAIRYVHKPGEKAEDLDSALFFIKKADELNERLHNKFIEAQGYYVYANAMREKGNNKEGSEAINKSVALFKSLPPSDELGEAYLEQANYLDLSTIKNVTQRKDLFEHALAAFRSTGNKQRVADALKDLADLNNVLGNCGIAITQLQEALSIYKSFDKKDLQGIYDLFSAISTHMGDFPNAVQYSLQAVKIAENIGDTSLQLCTIYNRLGMAYTNWLKTDEATAYYLKSLAIARKYKNHDYEAVVMINICNKGDEHGWQMALGELQKMDQRMVHKSSDDTFFLSFCYAAVYMRGHQYAAAKEYVNTLIKILPTLTTDDLSGRALVYNILSHYFLATHQFLLAKKYVSEYMNYCLTYGGKKLVATTYQLQSSVDSGLGNYKSALINYQKFTQMSDSLLNEAKSFQLTQMQIVYETEKKDHDLLLKKQNIELLTNKGQLQDIKLKKASQTRNGIITASLALIAVLFTGYEFKKRSNAKLLTKQQAINAQNEQLKDLLATQQKLVSEKEWLVKEIHHRVKNNLQIMISLLNAQSEFLDNPSALQAIKESREHMQAIAIIHQKLYQTENATVVNMPVYIQEMVAFLSDSFANSWQIRFALKVEDINLDISQAVPVGLILNEAITNAVKYAFPENRTGTIIISLQHVSDNEVLLIIKDDGQGFPEGFNFDTNNSFGIQLMKLFSEQLEGNLHFTSNEGVAVSLVFKLYDQSYKTADVKAAV